MLEVPRKVAELSTFLLNLLDKDNEHTEGEILEFNVPHRAMREILEYCQIVDFKAAEVSYKEKLQLNLEVTELGDLMTTKEIMFFQPKTLDELVQIANTANYLDMPVMIDACCAAIALTMRK